MKLFFIERKFDFRGYLIGRLYNFTGVTETQESTELTETELRVIAESERAIERGRECLEELVLVNGSQKRVGDDEDESSDDMEEICVQDKNRCSPQTIETAQSKPPNSPSTPNKMNGPTTPRTQIVVHKKKRKRTEH